MVYLKGTNSPKTMKFYNAPQTSTSCGSLTGSEAGWTVAESFRVSKWYNLQGRKGDRKVCVMLGNTAGWGTACGAMVHYK